MAEPETKTRSVRDWPERILGGAALLAGIALFGIMLLVTISVFFRYVLNAPILGSQELVQLSMVFVVMLAMPFTALKGMHIRVDIFDTIFGRRGRYITDLVSNIVGICVLFLLIRKSTDKAFDALEYDDVTNMIELPLWTAYAAIAIGMGLYMAVLALKLVRQVMMWRQYDE